MESWRQTNVVLPDGKSVVQVNISASPSDFITAAVKDEDLFYASILPKPGKMQEEPFHVDAEFSLSWTSNGVAQEVKHTTSHVFSGNNPAEWWLRLDGFLPLLPSSNEIHEPPAKKPRGRPSVKKQQSIIKEHDYSIGMEYNRRNIQPQLILDSVIGIVKIYVFRKSGKNSNNYASPFPISSGKVKVGEDVLPVSKELLAVHSPSFCALLFENVKEKGAEVLTLPDIFRVGLSSMLHTISTLGFAPQSVDAACELLQIANRGKVLGVMAKCSKYLQSVELNEKDASVILSSANVCGQSDLLKHALNSFSSPAQLRDAFCPLVGTASKETTVAAFYHLSDMVTVKEISPMNCFKVWFDDPHRGRMCFELFFDRAPAIAWSFVLLLGTNMDGDRGVPILVSTKSAKYTVTNKIWRKNIEGSTPRREDGWLLYTNSTTKFEITKKNHTSGHFFGKLVSGDPDSKKSIQRGVVNTYVNTSGLCTYV